MQKLAENWWHAARRFAKPAAAAGVAAAVLIPSSTSYADGVQNLNFYGEIATAEWSLATNNPAGGLFTMWNVSVSSVGTVNPLICDYQARMQETLPSGYVYSDTSSLHSGCNFPFIAAWFGFPSFGNSVNNGDAFPVGTAIRAYWKDNNTGSSFKKISGVTVNF